MVTTAAIIKGSTAVPRYAYYPGTTILRRTEELPRDIAITISPDGKSIRVPMVAFDNKTCEHEVQYYTLKVKSVSAYDGVDSSGQPYRRVTITGKRRAWDTRRNTLDFDEIRFQSWGKGELFVDVLYPVYYRWDRNWVLEFETAILTGIELAEIERLLEKSKGAES